MDKKEALRDKIRHLFTHVPGQFHVAGPAASPVQQIFGATDLASLFNAAFKTALVIGAILAVVRLIYAGAIYMTTDLPGAKGNAKEIIGEAVMGLLLLLAVWLILAQINPQILNLNILQNLPQAPATVAPPVASGPGSCSSGETWDYGTNSCVSRYQASPSTCSEFTVADGTCNLSYAPTNAPSLQSPWCFYNNGTWFGGNDRTCAQSSGDCAALRPRGFTAGTCQYSYQPN